MITKDIKSYLLNNYSNYLETISEMSKSDNGESLVNDERKLYNFDKITEEIYTNKTPESADSLYVSDKRVYFVEYKSGFKKRITKDNFDKKQMLCYKDNQTYCEEYGKLFFKNQKREDKILRNSIQFKAIESYMTFMEEIMPKSEDDGKGKKLVYCVVVDDYVENMEDILNGLAGKSSETNTITSMRQSLSRFGKTPKKNYYYDEINVFSPYEFKKFVTKNM
ncbi:MAG: hypothetical protein IKW30_12960 [Lachnospiraceae bacterium]|nr:hypothetical protein [Lachnospiraceae bacterium]